MTTSITTFLTYDTQAEEAATLYTSLFGGRIRETMRYPAGGPKAEGAVLSVTFELLGQTYVALNGGPTFTFSQGFSLMVQVDTQAEIDRLWQRADRGRRQGSAVRLARRQVRRVLADRSEGSSARCSRTRTGQSRAARCRR